MSGLLIHIGYHKTGSTWMQRHLFRPQLGFERPMNPSAVRGQIIYPHDFSFDADAVRARILPELGPALEAGRVPVLSEECFSGDLNERLHDGMRIADRLAEVFPGERVLIVLREQRAMIFSTYRQYVWNGGMLPLDAYLAGARWWWWKPFELAAHAYDRLVAHYQSRFGDENVLVLPYELFRRDGREFVSRIIDFAGAGGDPGALDALPFAARVNVGLPAVSVAVKRHLNRFARQRLTAWEGGQLVLDLSWRVGKAAPALLNRRLDERMRDAVASAVGDYYRESNARTSDLIGIDLGEYGYDLPARVESRVRS